MKKSVMKKWVAALKSGEYAYWDDSELRVDEVGKESRYSCLGVLSDIAIQEGIAGWTEGNESDYLEFGVVAKQIYQEQILHDKVRRWAGMRTNDGTICRKVSLFNLNSIRNFKESAAIIKSAWRHL